VYKYTETGSRWSRRHTRWDGADGGALDDSPFSADTGGQKFSAGPGRARKPS